MATNSCGGLPGYDAWKTTPPIEEGDPDEAQCPLCGRWVDYHELDDGPCAKCQTTAGVGGTPGCAAGTECEP